MAWRATKPIRLWLGSMVYVPVTDVELLQVFLVSSYGTEGILQVPYRATDDLVALGKVAMACDDTK